MIDPVTVRQILDAVDIVDVVSDFVSLRQRGANWVGLCPFHNDRTPSFYVSRAKGICKCFSCNEGGSAVNFIMKHENMTYVEALKYLAAKYHIEVKERELTDEQRAEQSEREAMLVLNEWACQFMEDQLWNTTDGQEIGLSYFRQRRGFSDDIIKKFRLGYLPEKRSEMYDAAIAQGYSRELLFKLGLCKDNNHGGGFDFFRGRAMFPIFNVAGKVIAFGGRTLKADQVKYFNSPESLVYSKSTSTMYGLYQAKRAISSSDRCFIVEGYADVISMHQAGFENVIASSGTALTSGHIHLLHRFTSNVTELFDGDSAGIKAALRGIDLLLKEGMNVKVLLLPDGEDPDSFAQSHSATQVEEYIKANETDFIHFKTRILLAGAERDPILKSKAIDDVVRSIAVIPSAITRSVYAKECSLLFGIQEQVLLREIQKYILKNKDDDFKRRQNEERRAEIESLPPQEADVQEQKRPVDIVRQERDIIKYVVKYGMCYFCDTDYDDGTKRSTSLAEYVRDELVFDYENLAFSSPVYKKIFETALGYVEEFYADLAAEQKKEAAWAEQYFDEQMNQIDPDGITVGELEKQEREIRARANAEAVKRVNEFRRSYLEKRLCSHPDDDVRDTSCDLVSEKYHLSKIHTQNYKITTEEDRLTTLVDLALNNWSYAIIEQQIEALREQMKQATTQQATEQLLVKQQQLYGERSRLAKLIGERVVNPK